MSKKDYSPEEFDRLFNFRDHPPVSNSFVYHYRCFMKDFWIFFIGFGAILLTVFIFPWIQLFVHPRNKARRVAQNFVSLTFRFFLFLLSISGIAKTICDDRKSLKNLKSKIVIANHPSILDTVVLISLIPNATVIAGEKYAKGPLGGVIKTCYIINSLDFDELCKRCSESLDMGCNVVIFPEGTRTPRHGHNTFKKGAARIARATGSDILPVFIAGSDKLGLGKNNPFWCFNHVEPLIYHIKMLDEIRIDSFNDLTDSIAAKRITDQMKKSIFDAAEGYKSDHPYSKTVNNV